MCEMTLEEILKEQEKGNKVSVVVVTPKAKRGTHQGMKCDEWIIEK